MSFHLPSEARKFFRGVIDRQPSGGRFILFDAYYLCVLLGLKHRKLGAEDELEADNFIGHYPDQYRPQADFVAGLLIDAEIDREQLKANDKAGIERKMIHLLNPSSPTGLSLDGSKLLNRYAVGGLMQLEEDMTPPAKLEDLLVRYADLWTAEVD